MSKNTNNPQIIPGTLDTLLHSRKFKGLRPYQIQELMAMYQWMEQNDPDFQAPVKVESQASSKARFISKGRHRKKMLRFNREHY